MSHQTPAPTLPPSRHHLWQWLVPLLILAGFVGIAGWSVQSMRQAAEERFRLEALNNCKVLEVAIAGETTHDEGYAGVQQQINALVAKDRRIVRLSFIGRDHDGVFRHLASSVPSRIGVPAQAEDLAALASGETIVIEEPYGDHGALDITFPIHDPHNHISGLIGYTVGRGPFPNGPLELAAAAVAVILTLCGYFFVQLRSGQREVAQRRRIEAILHQNDQMKNEFISTAAHELRTPLTSVIGYAEMLLDPEINTVCSEAQRHEFLCEIYDKADALARIVDNLLDISRIQSGRDLPLEREDCQISALLRREVGHFRLQAPRHQFELDLPNETDVSALIDRNKVVQVLENILSNAVKFSPNGGTIRVSGTLSGRTYQIRIADQGIGMTAEQCARIFDKFYRADASNVAIGGLGLGMSIARKIVLAHGGTIEVSSTLGQGTTVSVALPLLPADPDSKATPG